MTPSRIRLLRRKLLRDLWQIRWRALAVVLTAASGVGIYAGVGMAIQTGVHTRDVLLDRMRFADIEVQFLPEDVANLPDLTRVPGVRAVERRLVLPGTVLLGGSRRIDGVIVFLETLAPSIDALELVAGHPLRPGDFQSAIIERSLATFHALRLGDRIRVRVGEKVYESRIDGVAISPEYLITTANPAYLVPEKGSLGVVFTTLARVSDALGFTMVNDLLIRLKPGADPQATRDAVVQRLAKLNLERVIPKTEHFIWRHIQFALDGFSVYAPSIVLSIGILSFVLTFITVNRLVLDQRREIGALLALGYGRSQVFRAYLEVGALLGAVGGGLGTGLAFVFRDLFAETYARAIGFPELAPATMPALLATGFGVAVVETAIATAVPVARMLCLPPQGIMREPVSDGVGLATWRWGKGSSRPLLPVPVRFGLRNMARRPSRTLATVLAIGFSLGVSIGYVVSVTSALETTGFVFGRQRWDLAVDFLYPVPLEDLAAIRALPDVAVVEPYFRRFAEVGVGGHYETATILGVHPESEMRRTLLKAGRFLGRRADDLLVSQDLARRLAVRVGDEVTVRIRNDREFPFRVVGISGELVPGQAMMAFHRAQAIMDFDGAATGAYLATTGRTAALIRPLENVEYVAKVTTKQGVTAAFQKLMSDMLGLVYLASGVSVFIAMLFIFMSVNFVIGERRAEYAMFKCLGWGRGRLGATVLVQGLGEGGLAALVSIPVGLGLALYLNARMSQAWYEVLNIFHPGDVAKVLATAFVLIPVSAYPGLRALNRLNIVNALGTRVIE